MLALLLSMLELTALELRGGDDGFITAFVGDAHSSVSPDACNEKVAIIAWYDARLTVHFKHNSHNL
jgi:hypothetical protein